MKQGRVCEICCHSEAEGAKRIRRHWHPCSGVFLGWFCSRCTSLIKNTRYSEQITRSMKAYMDKWGMKYSPQKLENVLTALDHNK